MHDPSFVNPVCSSLNIFSTLCLTLHNRILQNIFPGTHKRSKPPQLSQLVRSPCFKFWLFSLVLHFWYLLYLSHLLNKATKHLTFTCVSALSISAMTWPSPGVLLVLIWLMASSISWYVISRVFICSWCLCLLLTDDFPHGLSLFRTVWTCL